MPYTINVYDSYDIVQNGSSAPSIYEISDVSNNQTTLSVDKVLYKTFESVFVAGRVIHVLWYCLGFFGNVVSAIIWLEPSLYEVCSSAHYLFAIAICDAICQFLHFFYYLKVFWNVSAFDNTDLCEFWSLVYMIPQYVGQLLVVGYTIDKLISIHHTFSGGGFNSQSRAAKIIVWIILIVTLMVFPQAYFWEGYCDVDRKGEHAIWNWLTLMVVYIVTPTVILFLNCRILYVFKHPEQFLLLSQSQAEFAKQIYERFKTSLRESIRILVTLSFLRVALILPDTIMRCLLNLDYFETSNLPPVYTMADAGGSQQWQQIIRLRATRLCVGFISDSCIALSVVVYCLTSPTFRFELRIRALRVKFNAVVFFYTHGTKLLTFIQNSIPCLRDDED